MTLRKTFPDSSVGAVHTAPGDFPSGKKGDVLTVEFIVLGIPCLGLNSGPAFKQTKHSPKAPQLKRFSASKHERQSTLLLYVQQ
jgi:predicted 3-demethylubiquinone-9 3-methyltransferase (glyoxalase superfamily)